MGGAINSPAFENNRSQSWFLALQRAKTLSLGVDEQERQGHLALPEQSEAHKVGEVCHLS